MLDRVQLRLRVALRWRQLDAALAEGADPTDDPALALRARRLEELRTRKAVARTLKNLLDAAQEPPSAWHKGDPRPPLQRQAILAARSELLALTERLKQPGDVPPQAVALATQFAWDSASPIYSASPSASVAEVARTIMHLLDEGPRSIGLAAGGY